jgi:hypothetical protein
VATPGFTPIDEGMATPKGFTPIEESPAQPKTFDPAQQTPGTATMRAAGPQDQPGIWDRLRSAVPLIDRIQSGLSGPASSPQEALAKPAPGMQTEQALQPENLMTPAQRQQHPIMTGAAEFAGGMTTPQNMLLTGMTAGAAPPAIARPLGALFSAQTLRGAYQELPDLQNAVKRQDWNEVERIGTHVTLGAAMAMLGARQAVEGVTPYEQFRKDGQQFAKVKQLSTTKEGIEANGVGLYNRVKDALLTHQSALEKQGGDAIQGAIDADNASQMIKGRGNISTSPAVTAAADILAKTGYDMKPGERAAINALNGKSELTLQEAKLLRTQVGRLAFGRQGSPEFKAAGSAAYDELGNAMKSRLGELYGEQQGNRLFDFYNNRFKMSFGLDQKGGVSEPMMSGIQNQDASASIKPLKDFSNGNIQEIAKQMRDTGNDQLASQLEKSQKDAKSLTAAHDTVNGKFLGNIRRMFIQHPTQAWPGLVVLGISHGMIGFPLAVGAAVGNMYRVARASAGEIGGRLRSEMPDEAFQTRTQAMPGETFTPKNPDAGWGPEYGGSPRNLSPQGGGGANYSASDLEAMKARHGIKDIQSNPVGAPEDTNITRERKGDVDDTKKAKIDQLQFLRARADQGDLQAKRRLRDIEKPVTVKEASPQARAEKRARLAKAKGVK